MKNSEYFNLTIDKSVVEIRRSRVFLAKINRKGSYIELEIADKDTVLPYLNQQVGFFVMNISIMLLRQRFDENCCSRVVF